MRMLAYHYPPGTWEMRVPFSLMFPLMRESPAPAGTATWNLSPRRRRDGTTKSPRHTPRRATFAAASYKR